MKTESALYILPVGVKRPTGMNKEPTPMRDMMRDQLPLMQGFIEHVHAEELAVMSEALDPKPAPSAGLIAFAFLKPYFPDEN